MCDDCFKITDFELLLDLLMPYDAAFPHLEDQLNNFFLDLSARMLEDFEFDSFKDYRTFGISPRAARYLELTISAKQTALVLLSLSLAQTLKRVPSRFPELAPQSASVLEEIINAVESINEGQS